MRAKAQAVLIAFLFAVAALAAQQSASYRVYVDPKIPAGIYLPDPSLTPGAVRTTDVREVCNGGSTKQFRHTTPAMKAQAYAAYGAKKQKGKCCEGDHLIPLELGGADDSKNLWAQPYPQAYWKDQVENWLHREVCAGRRDLVASQKAIAQNWYVLYLEMNSSQKAH